MRLLFFLLALYPFCLAAETESATGSLRSVFPEERAKLLADVLPLDKQVRWKLYRPKRDTASGVMVFVSPTDSGEPQPDWVDVVERQNLIWIAAEDFGNSVPSVQRVLVALMGLALVQKTSQVDAERIYIAGMSGGGRIASQTITKFPQLFTGAIYIVGVDFWTSAEQSLIEHIAANRYVFLTGSDDFNLQETKRIHKKYRHAGVDQTLLMNLRHFGHEYPDAEQLNRAIEFLDTGLRKKRSASLKRSG